MSLLVDCNNLLLLILNYIAINSCVNIFFKAKK
jgi:hypothetical protein